MKCEVCGNDYDKTIEVVSEGKSHIFDSFECAIHLLAPECAHCGCKVIGHGVQAADEIFCCAHCAEHAGVEGIHDRV
jgi:hypothetical protein